MLRILVRTLVAFAGTLTAILALRVGLPALGFALPQTTTLPGFAINLSAAAVGWYGALAAFER